MPVHVDRSSRGRPAHGIAGSTTGSIELALTCTLPTSPLGTEKTGAETALPVMVKW
jgi:hypothetical protein